MKRPQSIGTEGLPRISREKLLTIAETAELLQMSTSWIYKQTCARSIPFVKIGRSVRFDPARLREWLAKRVQEAT